MPNPNEDPKTLSRVMGVDVGKPEIATHTLETAVMADTESQKGSTDELKTEDWTKTSLGVSFAGLYLLATAVSMESQTTANYSAFATSSFRAHSLVSTASIVQGVVNSLIKPIMSKFQDFFGLFESFLVSVGLYVVAYILLATSPNMAVYAIAHAFYASGNQGLQILQEIFIANNTAILNRGLMSSIPILPFVVTVWVGPLLANRIISHPGWRWGYGMWAIILPVAFVPFAVALFVRKRQVKRRDQKSGQGAEHAPDGSSPMSFLKRFCIKTDLFGLTLFGLGITMILVPLSLLGAVTNGIRSPIILTTLFLALAVLGVFFWWESNPRLAPNALITRAMLRNRTLLAGLILGFLYFMAFYESIWPYGFSYFLVVHNKSVKTAGLITQSYSLTSTVMRVVVSLIIKFTGRYKYYCTIGACIYSAGIGLILQQRKIGASLFGLVSGQTLMGLGGGMLIVPVQVGVQASLPKSDVPKVTAVFLAVVELGGAVGSSISGVVWSSGITRRLRQYLPPEFKDQAGLIYSNVTLASKGWEPGTPVRDAINLSYQETMHNLLQISLGTSIPIIIASLFLANYDLKHGKRATRL